MKIKIISLGLTLFLISCDPTCEISITNASEMTKQVSLRPNHMFMSDKTSVEELENGILTFELSTNEKIVVGFSIGELQNDLPFDYIRITNGTDSIIASNKDQVLQLFDQNILGNLDKPFNITIH